MAPQKGLPSNNTICRKCGKTLATRRGRNVHENSVHRKKKRYPCKECDKSFPSCSSASRCGKKDRRKAQKSAQQSASQETTPRTPTRTTPRTRARRNLIRPPSTSGLVFFNAAHPSTAGPSTAGPSAGPFTAGPFIAGPFSAGPLTAGPFPAGPFPAGPFPAGPSDDVYPRGAYNPGFGFDTPDPRYPWTHPSNVPAPHQTTPPANNSAPHHPNPPANNPAPDQTNNPADLDDRFDQFGHFKYN